MNGPNPYSRIQPGQPPASTAGMGPYAPAPRVQAAPMQRLQQPAPMAPKPPPQQGGGMMGGMMGGAAGGGGGMMAGLSDERSKTEIARLEGQNEALTRALDQSFNGSNLPETQYPQLPQNTRLPSRGNFADSPAANQVAAQNVALASPATAGRFAGNGAQGAALATGPTEMVPPQNMQQSAGFARPNLSAPDLGELDRAYARMGQGR